MIQNVLVDTFRRLYCKILLNVYITVQLFHDDYLIKNNHMKENSQNLIDHKTMY